MIRRICVLVWLLGASRADAAMMTHEDLAGLVLDSEVVAIADRVGPGAVGPAGEPATRYQIATVLRGQLAERSIELWDRGYVTGDKPPDTRVVVFLSRRDGRWYITPSGLRVAVGGKVFRFEQHANPGPYVMVPQGADPDDTWGANGPQLDMAGLERAIVAASKRVDALAAATRLTDPVKRRAAVLALLPPPVLPAADLGFYVDRFAGEAREVLAKAGDTEGALMALARDRGLTWIVRDPVPLADLVAYATAATHPADLRAVAIAACRRHSDYISSAPAVRAMIGLVTDPEPRVRAAAIAAAAAPAGVISSDAKEQKLVRELARDAKAAIGKQFAVEVDNRVLVAAVDAFERFAAPLPARKATPPVVARLRIDGADLLVEVRCLRKAALAGGALIATHDGKQITAQRASVALRCGARTGGTNPSGTAALPVGHHALAVELTVDKLAVTVPLGDLDVAANGLQTRAP